MTDFLLALLGRQLTPRQVCWRQVVRQAKAGDPEELLVALGHYFMVDAEAEEHPLVKAILRDLSATMHAAALDYYASLK